MAEQKQQTEKYKKAMADWEKLLAKCVAAKAAADEAQKNLQAVRSEKAKVEEILGSLL